MLKQLVQLFAEKFLVSKKSEVRAWTYPKDGSNNVIQLSGIVAKTSFSYTPPADGIIQFLIKTNNSNNSIKIDGNLSDHAPGLYIEYSREWPVVFYRVEKGRTISFVVQALTSDSRVFFIPFN